MSLRARAFARTRAPRPEVYDLVVVGGSAGGLAAARRAAQGRARTLLVRERPRATEPCEVLAALRRAADAKASAAEALACARAVRAPAGDDAAALARAGVEVLPGRATLRSPRELDVDGRRVLARRVVLATGARPAPLAVAGLEPPLVVGMRELLERPVLPPRLAVLGDGPEACALAQACARLGSRVVLVASCGELVPGLDHDALRAIEAALREAGVELRLATEVAACERTGATARLALRPSGSSRRPGPPGPSATQLVEVEGVTSLLRVPDTEGLRLEEAGVAVSGTGLVEADPTGATSAPGVYAVGALVGAGSSEAAAVATGEVAAANALARGAGRFGRKRRFRPKLVPTAVLVRPEVACVGRTEAELRAARPMRLAFGPGRPRPVGRVSVVPLGAVGRARAEGVEAGFVKLLAAPQPLARFHAGGLLAGATVVGGPASELVELVALALRARLPALRLAGAAAGCSVAAALGLAAAQLHHEVDGRRWRPPADVLSAGAVD